MMPQVNSVFRNWTSPVQMKIVKKVAVDFENVEDTQGVVVFEMMLQVKTAKEVNRKPENERIWKWWTGWTDQKLEPDTVIQDPDGVEFRIQSTKDWSQAGFFECDMTEQPRGLDE